MAALEAAGAEQSALGLTRRQVAALLTLAACLRVPRKRVSRLYLSKVMEITRQGVTKHISALMDKGLVIQLPTGGLVLSQKGSELLTKLTDGSVVFRRCPHCGSEHVCRPK